VSNPIESEVQSQWRNAIALVKKLWAAGRTDASNILGLLDAVFQSAESDFAPNIINGGQNIRGLLAGIIEQAAALQTPHIQSYVRHIYNYYNLTDINDMLDKLYLEFAKGIQRIKSRQFSFDDPLPQILNWTYTLDGSVEPDADGWVLGGTDYCTAADGILTIDTIAPGGNAVCNYSKETAFVNANGTAAEFRMQVVTSAEYTDQRCQVIVLDDSVGMDLWFSATGIRVKDYHSAEFQVIPFDTSDGYHTYLIKMQGTTGKLYIDRHLKLVMTLTPSTGLNFVRFGDDSSGAGANSISRWDYFRYVTSLSGNNTGNGVILRLNKDAYDFDIESQHADIKKAKCVEDVSTGTAKWEEAFLFEGESAGIDELDRIGSGATKKITAVSARDSLLLNPSFSSFAGTIAAPTDITDWTSNITVNGTNYEIDEADYYRDFEGDTTPRALKIKASAILSQKLSLRGTVLDWTRPYLLQVAWKRDAGEGTLTINLGGKTTNVAVAAQSGWQLLYIPLDKDSWPKNFSQADTQISIQWAKTSGNIIIDDVLLIPLEEFDGSFYAIVPVDASPVQFRKDDCFDWSDAEIGSVIQYWLFRSFGRYLPHTTGEGITFADPS
jgi:hypothetical protein